MTLVCHYEVSYDRCPKPWQRQTEMKARILLVGDDLTLSSTRAGVLKEWQTASTTSRNAPEAVVTAQAYDLLILCQTVPEETARRLVALTCELRPQPKVLALYSQQLRGRTGLGTATYEIDLLNPGGLRNRVAALLKKSV